ncbi:lipid-A-disaccharide synthase [Spirulina major CS-329]|uniref:lipid-A-disaccharide synthase n=1 Tax=Spirulina TaxID=1154 RepID=UPI00232ADC45|nr:MULTISPECIES: lipid-A-disaccharide synthase [Spirulina]MDB9493471.1 lipid-A-disaccharide synthase [Spirulina subsalsa CS-330]MDB9503237.1 lipid-A-disaccharide synthase [Spirulina major CS-329]
MTHQLSSSASAAIATPAPTRQIFISTGEVSGDLQGSLLIEALRRQGAARGMPLALRGLGGERMANAGMSLVADTTQMSAFGIQEVLPMILPSLKINQQVRQAIQAEPPDLLILIDYEGFNISLGRYVKQHFPQTRIIYYIAPQLWVWNPFPSKLRDIVSFSDRIFAIFPDEAQYFGDAGGNVDWVGHPLIDRINAAPSRAAARAQLGIPADQLMIALLPASRPQELKTLLPMICTAAQQIQQQYPNAQFWLPLSVRDFRPQIEAALARAGVQATIVENQRLTTLAAADLAITKSGTVSLELALLNIPQVVVYRISWLTMAVARYIFKIVIPYVAPPNLLLKKLAVPELLQEEATVANICRESLDILANPTRRSQINADYERMKVGLGTPGVCDRTANAILDLITPPNPHARL